MILDLMVDSSKENRSFSYVAIKRLKKILHRHQWMDVWRLIHPGVGDYSFYLKST